MKDQQHTFGRFRLKQVILAALLFMMLGTTMELYLLDHYEGTLQLIPLLCIGSSLLVVILLLFRKTDFLFTLFQWLMVVTAGSGLYGVFLHLKANYEFELEMQATAKGWDLFMESLAGALPSLAPASMIVLALIGYSYLILLKQTK